MGYPVVTDQVRDAAGCAAACCCSSARRLDAKLTRPCLPRLAGDRNTLFDVEWHRIVLDEGHTIRNYNSTFALGCSALRAQRRWILTGTPLQNKIEELSSFFIFLDVSVLQERSGTQNLYSCLGQEQCSC